MTKPWSKHKALLYRLYISEKHKLKKVMEIMEKKHDFVARYVRSCFPLTTPPDRLKVNWLTIEAHRHSRRTYMKMFSRWGYKKNRKSPVRGEDGSSGGVNKQHSDAELKIWETATTAPTYKIINGKTRFPLLYHL